MGSLAICSLENNGLVFSYNGLDRVVSILWRGPFDSGRYCFGKKTNFLRDEVKLKRTIQTTKKTLCLDRYDDSEIGKVECLEPFLGVEFDLLKGIWSVTYWVSYVGTW